MYDTCFRTLSLTIQWNKYVREMILVKIRLRNGYPLNLIETELLTTEKWNRKFNRAFVLFSGRHVHDGEIVNISSVKTAISINCIENGKSFCFDLKRKNRRTYRSVRSSTWRFVSVLSHSFYSIPTREISLITVPWSTTSLPFTEPCYVFIKRKTEKEVVEIFNK